MNRQTQDSSMKRMHLVEENFVNYGVIEENSQKPNELEEVRGDSFDEELSQIFFDLMNLDDSNTPKVESSMKSKIKEKQINKTNIPCDKKREHEPQKKLRTEKTQGNQPETSNQAEINPKMFCSQNFQDVNQFTVYNQNQLNHQYHQYYSAMTQPLSHQVQFNQSIYQYGINQYNPAMPFINSHPNIYNVPMRTPQMIVPVVYPQSFYFMNSNNIYPSHSPQVYPINAISSQKEDNPTIKQTPSTTLPQKSAGKKSHPISDQKHKASEPKLKKSNLEIKKKEENKEIDIKSGKCLAQYVITTQGSRRVQKQLINNIKDPQVILKEILSELPLIVTNCFGMQFFQALIKLLPMESRFNCWKSLISNNLLDLVNNDYGNLSIKSLIECVLNPIEEDHILSVFKPYFTKLAYTKQGSDILQTIVYGFSDQSKKPLIDFIEDSIFSLVYDSVGSLLVLKTIESMVAKSLELKVEFINILYQQSTKLITDANGSHVLIKLLEEWGIEAFQKFYNLIKANLLTYINLKYSSALIIKLLPKLSEVSFQLTI